MAKNFTVRFEDRNGSLLQNRKVADEIISLYFNSNGSVNREFTEFALAIDAREKGLRIVRYTANETGIFALVEYL